ncbi:hypothetical protein WMY93_034261 [Mugilogobius chulae]|uniref:Uncharacterized protein n=1 Tax=Mugilogobius chulae TaxID=88201 RepID=A0AAW0MHN9_9GOBI
MQLKEHAYEQDQKTRAEAEEEKAALAKECEDLKRQLRPTHEKHVWLDEQCNKHKELHKSSKQPCLHQQNRCSSLEQELKTSDQQRALLEALCHTLQLQHKTSEEKLALQVQTNCVLEQVLKSTQDQQTLLEQRNSALEQEIEQKN